MDFWISPQKVGKLALSHSIGFGDKVKASRGSTSQYTGQTSAIQSRLGSRHPQIKRIPELKPIVYPEPQFEPEPDPLDQEPESYPQDQAPEAQLQKRAPQTGPIRRSQRARRQPFYLHDYTK